MSLPLDEIEAKYEVLHKLGEGGMGAVYKVRHRLLGEVRVIKVIQPQHQDSQEAQARFRSEAQAAIRLRHPNIAQIHDFSVDAQGTAYIVMEYIEGLTLEQLLKEGGPPDLPLTLEIATQTLGALGYLHQQGYVHRDISPDNLMLSRNFDGAPWVKLIDLGLAKHVAGDPGPTAKGMFVGKARYASPEQFRHSAEPAGPRSDLYAFGVVLYELLTGTCPIQGSSFEKLIAAHLFEPVPDFAETDPEGRVPAGLRRAVLLVLEKDPDRRPASAEALSALLAPFREGHVPSFDELRRDTGHTASLPDDPTPAAVGLSGATARMTARRDALPPTVRADRGRAAAPPRAVVARRRRVLAVAVAVLVLLAVAAAWTLRPVPAAAQGRVVLDAVPWARVTSVVDAEGVPVVDVEGVPVAVARELYTPVVLSLATGAYEITFENPDFPGDRTVRVEVTAATTTTRSVELGAVDVDAYFAVAGLAETLRQAGI